MCSSLPRWFFLLLLFLLRRVSCCIPGCRVSLFCTIIPCYRLEGCHESLCIADPLVTRNRKRGNFWRRNSVESPGARRALSFARATVAACSVLALAASTEWENVVRARPLDLCELGRQFRMPEDAILSGFSSPCSVSLPLSHPAHALASPIRSSIGQAVTHHVILSHQQVSRSRPHA